MDDEIADSAYYAMRNLASHLEYGRTGLKLPLVSIRDIGLLLEVIDDLRRELEQAETTDE